MKRPNTTSPLKAYQIFVRGGHFDGRPFLMGIYVGRSGAQARAEAARDRADFGATNPWQDLQCRRLRDEEWELAAIEEHEDRGKYWRHTRKYARQVAAAEAFNAKYPVGTVVQVVDCCEADTWPDGITRTRTPAWAPSESAVFVSVEGYAGGFYLQHIKPLQSSVTLNQAA